MTIELICWLIPSLFTNFWVQIHKNVKTYFPYLIFFIQSLSFWLSFSNDVFIKVAYLSYLGLILILMEAFNQFK